MEITIMLVAIFYFLLIFTLSAKAHAMFRTEKTHTFTSNGMNHYMSLLAGFALIFTVLIIIVGVVALLL